MTPSRLATVLLLTATLLAVFGAVTAVPRPAPQVPDCQDGDEDEDYDYGDAGGGDAYGNNGVYNNGMNGMGASGYAQGPNAYSSYSGYGAGNIGGYGGGHADPSGRSASSFGVGYGR